MRKPGVLRKRLNARAGHRNRSNRLQKPHGSFDVSKRNFTDQFRRKLAFNPVVVEAPLLAVCENNPAAIVRECVNQALLHVYIVEFDIPGLRIEKPRVLRVGRIV